LVEGTNSPLRWWAPIPVQTGAVVVVVNLVVCGVVVQWSITSVWWEPWCRQSQVVVGQWQVAV